MAKSHIKEATRISRRLKKKSSITAGGGKLVGVGSKKTSPTDGRKGGYAVGDKHSAPSGGISAKVGSSGKPILFEGGEAIITAPALSDNSLHEFEGRKMTKRQILSAINQDAGGVAFAKGGKIKVKYGKKQYKYGGKLMSGGDIIKDCGCKHAKMEKGGKLSGGGGVEKSEKNDNFTSKGISHEVQHILSGAGQNSDEDIIYTTANYLRASKTASSKGSNKNLWKEEERSIFLKYIDDHSLWIENTWHHRYLGEGVEQKVYFFDDENVIKFNDAVFYSSWLDYLNNLILHNHYFPDTSYKLIGFLKKDNTVFAAVKQTFIQETSTTDFNNVKTFLIANGFTNKKNDDYYNPEIGLILEDLHPGNVITRDGMYYFIDTVFYITGEDGNVIQFNEGGQIPPSPHAKLIADISALKLAAGYKMFEGHPEELLKYIQEQATGMDATRKSVYPVAYHSVVKMVGKKIVIEAVKALSGEEKKFLLEQYKEQKIGIDPALKKALQTKSMESGGEIQQRNPIALPESIVNDDQPHNSQAYQHYKKGGVMAKGGKVKKDGSAEMTTDQFLLTLQKLRKFVPGPQIESLMQIYRTEERDYAVEIMQRLLHTFETMPKTYGTEKQETDEKVIYLHYFYGSMDWYIVERDSEPAQYQAFGYVDFGDSPQGGEWGYISIVEIMQQNKIELDFHWKQITFGELKNKGSKEEDNGTDVSASEQQPARKYKVGDKVRLKPKYLKQEPVMHHFNEATITELSSYYTPETGYMYDTVISQDKSPRHFYESEIELIEPTTEGAVKDKIRDIATRSGIPQQNIVIASVSAPATKQQSGTTGMQQAAINDKIRSLVKQKGSDRNKYSAEEIALLKLYEGAGAEKKTSTDARILDQFFTPMDICAKMWGLAFKHGFTWVNSKILEPAVGSGRFLSFIPADASGYTRAYDVDEVSVTICQVLYPNMDIRHGSFEQEFFKGRRHVGLSGVDTFFDLVIGNPPYREYVSEYAPLGEKKATGAATFEMYFIDRGVDLLRPGGLLIYVIPNTFMSNESKYNDFKERLAKKCILVDAYRLPNSIFNNTDIGTDIIVLKKSG